LMSTKPYVVGIAGTTCSGKSRLAWELKERFRDKQPVVISCDSYYRDLSELHQSERETRNFDAPEAIEIGLLHSHLRTLAEGKEVLCPVYDFATHTRESHSVRIIPGEVVIVEGLFVLYWEDLRGLFHTKVFVSLLEEVALSRRLDRDVRERGRTHESVLHQYSKTVKPMTDKYVLPTKGFADILVSGSDPIEQSAAIIIERIESLLKGATGHE
jgi:uridine kinase